MKTTLRVLALGVGVSSLLLLSVGCKEDEANAEGFDFPDPGLAAEQVPLLPVTAVPAAKEGDAATPASTNALPAAAVTATNGNDAVIGAPPTSEPIKLSTPLLEVIKLAQAGVGEDVLTAFVTNSAAFYEVGSSEILYLHDLGIPAPVISAIVQHDALPENKARRGAVQALPPGVALTTPAANVYPGKYVGQPAEPVAVNESTNINGAGPVPEPTVAEQPVTVEPPAVPQEPVTVEYFQTALAPYGSWVDVPGYGTCWRPTVAVCDSAWRPYADHGRWVWSDAGWYWYSDYSWGWAPFHYGRWACPQGVGWVWTPDTCWGPSWVSWRYSSSYCGWAPLPPSAVWGGHGFYHNTISVGIGFEFGLCDFDYVFLPFGRFCDRTPYHYYTSASHARAIYKDSTVVNNYVVGNHNTIINQGVGLDRVAKVTRGDIRQVALKDGNAVRDLGPRRERLETDGKTLTVVRPTLVNSRVESPLKPISAMSGIKQSAPAAGLASIKNGGGSSSVLGGSKEGSVFPSTRATSMAGDKTDVATWSSAGGSAIFKPRPNERIQSSTARPADMANQGNSGISTPSRSIVIKPSGAVAKPVNAVPSWMNATPAAPANINKTASVAPSASAPQASGPVKSAGAGRTDSSSAPAYTRPGATKAPSYRAPESSPPRLGAPSPAPSSAPSTRLQPAPGASVQRAPSVTQSGSARAQAAPASSGKSDNSSRASSGR